MGMGEVGLGFGLCSAVLGCLVCVVHVCLYVLKEPTVSLFRVCGSGVWPYSDFVCVGGRAVLFVCGRYLSVLFVARRCRC